MNVLALCAGVGGLELGIKLATANAARVVCIVERDVYCASVLQARMDEGRLDRAPIWTDVKTFDAKAWRGRVDCITAGYPCQPWSCAGRRKGEQDPRHLWPHIARHVRSLRPRYVFCENVPGHLTLGFEQVVRDLRRMGYRVEAGIFSAAEVGAPHLRKRLYFLADAQGSGRQARSSDALRASARSAVRPFACGCGQKVADAVGSRRDTGQSGESGAIWHQARGPQLERRSGGVGGPDFWSTEPAVGRVAAGVSHRLDRLAALGNAVVPQVAALAWRTLNAQISE